MVPRRRSIACRDARHDTCAQRARPCGCPCHVLTAAARRASVGGLTYTARLEADRTVGVRRVDAAGVVTEFRFAEPHAALGFLDAEAERRS